MQTGILIKTIIQNGIDAGDDIAYGSTYKIVVTHGAANYTDPPIAMMHCPKSYKGKKTEAIL